MSRIDANYRLQFIVNKLRNKQHTWKEIQEALANDVYINGYNTAISKRTFHRDIHAIRELFQINIANNPTTKRYYVATEKDEVSQRSMELLNIFSLLKTTGQQKPYLLFLLKYRLTNQVFFTITVQKS